MHVVFGLILIGIGVVDIIWPERIFRREERKYKEQREPSDEHLDITRLKGVGIILLGILVMTGACGLMEM